jgi:hypothetical protein
MKNMQTFLRPTYQGTVNYISLSQPTKIKNHLQDNQLSIEDLKYISTPSKISALPSTVLTEEMSPNSGEESNNVF